MAVYRIIFRGRGKSIIRVSLSAREKRDARILRDYHLSFEGQVAFPIKQIAKRNGVSPATVHKVMNKHRTASPKADWELRRRVGPEHPGRRAQPSRVVFKLKRAG